MELMPCPGDASGPSQLSMMRNWGTACISLLQTLDFEFSLLLVKPIPYKIPESKNYIQLFAFHPFVQPYPLGHTKPRSGSPAFEPLLNITFNFRMNSAAPALVKTM